MDEGYRNTETPISQNIINKYVAYQQVCGLVYDNFYFFLLSVG
jgi:hypothetical protein